MLQGMEGRGCGSVGRGLALSSEFQALTQHRGSPQTMLHPLSDCRWGSLRDQWAPSSSPGPDWQPPPGFASLQGLEILYVSGMRDSSSLAPPFAHSLCCAAGAKAQGRTLVTPITRVCPQPMTDLEFPVVSSGENICWKPLILEVRLLRTREVN